MLAHLSCMTLHMRGINMLSEDTLVLTKRGFKPVKDLMLYDNVLTPFGDYEPIMELGPWTEMTKKVSLNTCEDIICTGDLLLLGGTGADNHAVYAVDELDGVDFVCSDVFPPEKSRKNIDFDPYKMAVVVPEYVPDKIILSTIDKKLEFLAGLIDSPICQLGLGEGCYNLYIKDRYKRLADSILALVRSLDLPVSRILKDRIYRISIKFDKYIDIIPIRDEMKMCFEYASNGSLMRVEKISDLSNNDKKIMGRRVKVNGSWFLVGYSLLTVG